MSRSNTPNKTLNNLSNINPQLKATILGHHMEENYVIYSIKISDELSNDEWFFESRFSEISQLNNAIVNSKQISISDLPKFPKKKYLWSDNKDPQLIIKRRKKLELFLNHIFSHETILNLVCVQAFLQRIKREYQIFKIHRENPQKKVVNLEKKVEKTFLDEIDSSISNSDFLDIMEKYEEYENQKDSSPERSPSKFLKPCSKEKTKEVPFYENNNNNDELAIKLEKIVLNANEITEDNIDLNQETQKALDEIKETLKPLKSMKREKTPDDKVRVVYMTPLLKIDRSGSMKKLETMKKSDQVKRGFFHNYFHNLCGANYE